MESERLLATTTLSRRERSRHEADIAFRSRLEHSVDSAFRLANVILGPTGDADDATQDAIERAWRSRHSLRDPQSFDAWFQRIVVNSCRDRIRRTKASPVFIVVEHDDRPAGGADIATSAAQRDAVRAALDRLNSDQRIAIVLRYFLDLEVDEIARRTGTRPGTVKSRLHRGLEQLRDVWELEQ